MLETRPLSDAAGVEVLNVDLACVEPVELDALYALCQREPLVLLRKQFMTEGELVGYSHNATLPRIAKRNTIFMNPGQFGVPCR